VPAAQSAISITIGSSWGQWSDFVSLIVHRSLQWVFVGRGGVAALHDRRGAAPPSASEAISARKVGAGAA
jgi:hypothetical protein